MSLRNVKGRLRVESPRLKDLARPTAREPSVGRAEHGQFAPANGEAIGRGLKQLVREGLEGLDAELAKDAMTMYRTLCRDLASCGPSVRQLVAARCRHAVFATAFANEAAKAGLATPQGIKLAEQSRAHDLAAQRLAVTALDLATRGASPHRHAAEDMLRRRVMAGRPDDAEDDGVEEPEPEPADARAITIAPTTPEVPTS